MRSSNPPLPLGYSPVPPGCLATVVTYLEMTTPPQRSIGSTLDLAPFDGSTDDYRALFRRVGEDWLWISRLLLSDVALRAILNEPAVEVLVPRRDGAAVGILELDFRVPGECEIVFFGLVPEAIGTGMGRTLMDAALARAWSGRGGQPVGRVWLHTCHLDHPGALAFYRRCGFRSYKLAVEIVADPRLDGRIKATASPHVPPVGR